MPLRDFIDAFTTNDGGTGGEFAGGGVTGYMAQHDFLGQVPEASAACSPTPPYVGCEDAAGDAMKTAMRRVWLGPAGTVTPLHRDPYHNLLCQVWGSKLVYLYKAEDEARVYPFPNGFLRNTSRVDAESPDIDRYPLFKSASRWEVILGPGEMLFMPAKTWHYVRATGDSCSLSVSYWWGRARRSVEETP